MSTPISAEQILAKRRLQNRLAQRKRRQRLQANGRQGSRSSHGSAEFVNAIQADHQLPEGHVENTDWDRNQSVLETQANHPEHPDSSPRGATHNNPTEPMTESWEALLSNLERSESSTLLVDTNQEGNKSTERPLGESPKNASAPGTCWKTVSQKPSDKNPFKAQSSVDIQLDLTPSLSSPGTDISIPDQDILDLDNGMTALHLCASKGHVRAVEILLEYGIDVDIVDSQNRTALHIACCMGNTEIVALLLQEAAGTEAMDCNGYTPLHIACRTGNYEIVKLLLSSGTDLNTRVGGK